MFWIHPPNLKFFLVFFSRRQLRLDSNPWTRDHELIVLPQRCHCQSLNHLCPTPIWDTNAFMMSPLSQFHRPICATCKGIRVKQMAQMMLFCSNNICTKVLLHILSHSFCIRHQILPYAVAVKFIKKCCSALALKMLVKSTPGANFNPTISMIHLPL